MLKSTAAVLGVAYGFDYVLKASNERHAKEHARRHEFEGIIGELRAARQAKFEQPRPIPPSTIYYPLFFGIRTLTKAATNDIWSLDFSKAENVAKLLNSFSSNPGGGKH